MKIKKRKVKTYFFADCGEYILLSDGKLPETGGTGRNGGVQRANQFRIRLADPNNPVNVGGVEIINGAKITAKVKKPGQDIQKWDVQNG